MYNLIRAELFKLRKDRSFRMLMLLLACASLGYPLLYYFDSVGEPQRTGADFLVQFISGNGFIIKFGVAILAGFFIANEYSTGVMKTIASSGNDRWKLFAAKLAGFLAGAMALSLVFPVASTIEASILSGFGHLPEGTSALYIPRALGLTMLYAAGYAALGALFTAILTDSGKTIGFSIIFFVMIDSVLVGLGTRIPFLATVYDYSIFKRIGDIGAPRIDSGELPAMVLVPVLTIVASGLLGIAVYRRKEIK
ncbi:MULTISPECIES: ABC transporter permease [unclassified Paenibacillus]|uniref:ABC transporter permease n=1 Tax=unclassified Paenibacillus TaxID=185978 RepID=UPI0009559696|nr:MULTISPECIES: ABC transporter permease [unclassified Paenibacillus]ASS67765.1 ABC transporter permease [Paenibacillus sp. RUD330]SIR61223.1 ABC-2 type transport system permease protein [Paenibacillus sp. RU4X]SIR69862.1 ABC-2 type transport system permease protein [Paenibacillus sp. RU4T]